jgi:hypothetical protein
MFKVLDKIGHAQFRVEPIAQHGITRSTRTILRLSGLLFALTLVSSCAGGVLWCTHSCEEPGQYTTAFCGCAKLNDEPAPPSSTQAIPHCICGLPSAGTDAAGAGWVDTRPANYGINGIQKIYANPTTNCQVYGGTGIGGLADAMCERVYTPTGGYYYVLYNGTQELNISRWETQEWYGVSGQVVRRLYRAFGSTHRVLPVDIVAQTDTFRPGVVDPAPQHESSSSADSGTPIEVYPGAIRNLPTGLTCQEICNSTDSGTASACFSLPSQAASPYVSSLHWLASRIASAKGAVSRNEILAEFNQTTDLCERSDIQIQDDALLNVGSACQAAFNFGGLISGSLRLGGAVRGLRSTPISGIAKVSFDRHAINLMFDSREIHDAWGGSISEIIFDSSTLYAEVERKACISVGLTR